MVLVNCLWKIDRGDSLFFFTWMTRARNNRLQISFLIGRTISLTNVSPRRNNKVIRATAAAGNIGSLVPSTTWRPSLSTIRNYYRSLNCKCPACALRIALDSRLIQEIPRYEWHANYKISLWNARNEDRVKVAEQFSFISALDHTDKKLKKRKHFTCVVFRCKNETFILFLSISTLIRLTND